MLYSGDFWCSYIKLPPSRQKIQTEVYFSFVFQSMNERRVGRVGYLDHGFFTPSQTKPWKKRGENQAKILSEMIFWFQNAKFCRQLMDSNHSKLDEIMQLEWIKYSNTWMKNVSFQNVYTMGLIVTIQREILNVQGKHWT